jgi:hypothetical protein
LPNFQKLKQLTFGAARKDISFIVSILAAESFKKQEFVDLVHSTSLDLVKQHAIELVMIGLHYAREGSSQHWKVLMEMGKLYIDKRALEQEDEVVVTVRFADPYED